MIRNCFYVIITVFLVACTNDNHLKKIAAHPTKKRSLVVSENNIKSFDTVFHLFTDTNYQLIFHAINTESFYESYDDKYNTILTFVHYTPEGKKTLFVDSLSCMNVIFDTQDFDNDKIADLMIFHSDGARANPRYYLYLVKPNVHQLINVKGFEEIPSPELDSSKNIIFGSGLFGNSIDNTFFRINKSNKLIQLHRDVVSTADDTIKVRRAVNQIVKRWGTH